MSYSLDQWNERLEGHAQMEVGFEVAIREMLNEDENASVKEITAEIEKTGRRAM
jgi:hypothetical protein